MAKEIVECLPALPRRQPPLGEDPAAGDGQRPAISDHNNGCLAAHAVTRRHPAWFETHLRSFPYGRSLIFFRRNDRQEPHLTAAARQTAAIVFHRRRDGGIEVKPPYDVARAASVQPIA